MGLKGLRSWCGWENCPHTPVLCSVESVHGMREVVWPTGPALSDIKDHIGPCIGLLLPVETPSRQERNLKEMQVEYYGIEMAQQSLATKHLGGLGWRSR